MQRACGDGSVYVQNASASSASYVHTQADGVCAAAFEGLEWLTLTTWRRLTRPLRTKYSITAAQFSAFSPLHKYNWKIVAVAVQINWWLLSVAMYGLHYHHSNDTGRGSSTLCQHLQFHLIYFFYTNAFKCSLCCQLEIITSKPRN